MAMEREDKAEPINGKEKKKGEENKDEELTEEDRGLKENLDLLVERIVEENAKADVQKAALDTVREEIRTSTSTMTSVPKPLKFLKAHFLTLKECYEKMIDGENKRFLADVISVLAMAYHTDHLESLRLSKIVPHIDEGNYQRTCLYLLGCASYLQEPEDKLTLQVAYDGYLKVNKLPDAMRVALKLNNMDLIVKTFNHAASLNERKQLAYMMSRQNVPLDLEDGPAAINDESEREIIMEILGNARINEQFLMVARDLDVMEAKTPEDIYKSHLIEGRVPTSTTVSSARQNLASSFVNAFVNAGFGHDKLLTETSEDR
eukprot:jgi/Pico_ML_1/50714/g1874.t2